MIFFRNPNRHQQNTKLAVIQGKEATLDTPTKR